MSEHQVGVGRLLIVGLGLMGGSLALAARRRGLCREVIGYSRSETTLADAVRLHVVDRVAPRLPTALSELKAGDLVVIGVPTQIVPDSLAEIRRYTDSAVTLTDVASVKGSVVAAAQRVYGAMPPQFVPGHPIAGSEKSGVGAARADLYERHEVILTPVAETDPVHLERVRNLWSGVGAQVSELTPEVHDQVLAATSHLPHMLAFGLVDTLADMARSQEIFRYAAGGFRDFTRIAGSDPVMWRDIALANRAALVAVFDRFEAQLAALRAAIARGDSDFLTGVFTRAQASRRHFEVMQESKPYMSISTRRSAYRVAPGGSLTGDVRVPGDKSISHRAIMLGALAEGVTRVQGFLEGEDSLATLQAFRDMGVIIEGPDHGALVIHGVGMTGLKPPAGPLYLGNSGTSMRLLTGLLAGQGFDVTLAGDESLSRRPMRRVTEPLARMGARIEATVAGTPPLAIAGGHPLRGIRYDLPIASAQVKSCLLLAGLRAEGETDLLEPAPTRDHTERMLRGFQYPVRNEAGRIRLAGGGKLVACDLQVPGDISSAAFFLVGASIAPGSDLTLRGVGVNPTRDGVIHILRAMGADIELLNAREVGGEPVADIRVRAAPLKGIAIPPQLVANAIDEFPALFIAAACAEGTTVLTGAEELRVKESDRIQAMADGLSALGIDAQPTPDGIRIVGGTLGAGTVESQGDHRIAMAFAMAALRATGTVVIHDCTNVLTSFPGFPRLANGVGLGIVEVAE
ncbi:MAG: bifunctional prephenate dehydrogenase/3-phosphoshikimate 1-carboxyvinyltransferase [Porticoccaceae bacterium]